VPLAAPLLAGPGAIVAAMLAVPSSGGTVPGWVAIMLALIAVNICLYLGMRFAVIVHRVLGEGGTMLITRISGLLLAAIAVQLIADAIRAFVTGVQGPLWLVRPSRPPRSRVRSPGRRSGGRRSSSAAGPAARHGCGGAGGDDGPIARRRSHWRRNRRVRARRSGPGHHCRAT